MGLFFEKYDWVLGTGTWALSQWAKMEAGSPIILVLNMFSQVHVSKLATTTKSKSWHLPSTFQFSGVNWKYDKFYKIIFKTSSCIFIKNCKHQGNTASLTLKMEIFYFF